MIKLNKIVTVTNHKHMKEAFSAWKIAPLNVKNSDTIRHKKIKKKSEINESKQELMQSIDLKSVMFDVK